VRENLLQQSERLGERSLSFSSDNNFARAHQEITEALDGRHAAFDDSTVHVAERLTRT